MQNPIGYDEACKVLDKHLTPRARLLNTLERNVEGTQYDGLPDWFSDEKPLWERKPCIIYPIVKLAIDSNRDLLLGEGRFPLITVDSDDDDDDAAAEDSETEKGPDEFEKTVNRVIKQAKLRPLAFEVFAAAQGCGSACAIFGIRGNRLCINTVFARWCTPTLDPEGAVLELEVKFPFIETVDTGHGEKKAVCRIFRRVIDKTSDITFFPALAPEDGSEPKSWTPETIVNHGLGFCPVIWYAHVKGCSAFKEYDGKAIHRHLLDEIRAHDFTLSQKQRAAMYCGDPQWTESGVEAGYNPTTSGSARKATMINAEYARPGEAPGAVYIGGSAKNGKARKKSPGTVWQYPGDASKIKIQLHTLPPDALKAIDDHARDLKGKLAESLGVVIMDAASLPNESRLSGRALETLVRPQLSRVDYFRSDFGDNFLIPAVGMLLRIAVVGNLKIKGLDLVTQLVAEQGDSWSWHSPPLQAKWGDYFKLSGEEEELVIRGMSELKAAGLGTKKVIVQRLRDILNIKNVAAYLKELEAETAVEDEKALKTIEATAKATAAAKPAPAKASAA